MLGLGILDLFLLNKWFEPLSAEIHKLFNLSNYTIAKILLGFSLIGVLFYGVCCLFLNNAVDIIGTLFFSYWIIWPALKLAVRFEKKVIEGFDCLPNFRVPNKTETGRVVRSRIMCLFCMCYLILMNSAYHLGLWIRAQRHFTTDVVSSTKELAAQHASELLSAFFLFLLVPMVSGLYFLSCTPRKPRKKNKKSNLGLRK